MAVHELLHMTKKFNIIQKILTNEKMYSLLFILIGIIAQEVKKQVL